MSLSILSSKIRNPLVFKSTDGYTYSVFKRNHISEDISIFEMKIAGWLPAPEVLVPTATTCDCNKKKTTIDFRGKSLGNRMLNRFRWVLWACSLVLIGNFIILRMYGDALRSTHLFIVCGTVYYPLAWLNLVLGIFLAALLVWQWLSMKWR